MENYIGKIILYKDKDEKLNFVKVSRKNNGKLSCVNSNGKNIKLTTRTIIYFEEFEKELKDYMAYAESEIPKLLDEIDIELIWAETINRIAEYDLVSLSKLYFDEVDIPKICALYKILSENEKYFRKKQFDFIPYTEEEIQLAEKKIKEDKLRLENENNFIVWVNKNLYENSDKVQLPEEFAGYIDEIKKYIHKKKDSRIIKKLNEFFPTKSIRDVIYDLFLKLSLIPEDLERILFYSDIDYMMPKQAVEYSETIKLYKSDNKRVDLTYLPTFTIDDKLTTVIDDAVSLEKKDDGNYIFYFHIADCAYFIKKDDELDKVAYSKCTNIYLPTKVYFMLPEYISENIASLKLNEIRPAISVKVEVTNEFKILNSEIILAEIRVTNKICYEEIDTILNSDETDEISQLIKIMQKFSEVLLENRLENGASLITRKEPTIKVKDNEIYFSIHEDSLSYKMIAEFMIFTNFVIADFANKKGIPIIYKTQDYIDDFNDYSLVRMTEYNPITFRKIIRKMKKSDFSVYPGKHSSLGVELYTQCSSPLRRFHDLVIQRQIEAYLYNEKLPYSGEEILELLVQAEYITDIVKRVCSESEKFWILKYFEKYLIENDFTATIIEKNKKGDYIVELDDYYVIGKILDENNLNIGDKIHIQISKLLPEQYILYFRLIE